MTKPEALKLMRLLYTMESYLLALNGIKPLPEFIGDELLVCMDVLEREILGPEIEEVKA